MGNNQTKVTQTIDIESQVIEKNISQYKITDFFKIDQKQKHSRTENDIIEELKQIKC